jgi:hypothetical protein
MPLVPVTPSPVQVEVEGAEQATAFADGIVKTDSPENKSDVIKPSEIVLTKCRPDLPIKVEQLRDTCT